MKKAISILLCLCLVCALSACGGQKAPVPASPTDLATPAPTEAPAPAPDAAPVAPAEQPLEAADPDDYVGTWAYGRAMLSIARYGAGCKCVVHWAGSAAEYAQWEYDCLPDGGGMTAERLGQKQIITCNPDGSIAQREVVFSDGAARFELLSENTLRWTDYKEYPTGGVYEFERVEMVNLSTAPEEFAEGYFRVIGAFHPGTSGATLGMAAAATEAVRFALAQRFWCADIEEMRDNMLSGWESLSDDERAAFDENFLSVVELVRDCKADWESNRGSFESAGVDGQMEALLLDPMTLVAWDTLVSNTLTMGNSDK